MGTAAASTGAAGPFRDYGPRAAPADGLSRSTPRQADDMTTRPSGSGPTLQSDARDSEPRFTISDEGQAGCQEGDFFVSISSVSFLADDQQTQHITPNAI